MVKTTEQVATTLEALTDQMLANADAGNFDLAVVYLHRANPDKTFKSRAHITFFGASVVMLDMMNRMGLSNSAIQRIREIITESMTLDGVAKTSGEQQPQPDAEPEPVVIPIERPKIITP
jgi:hypothetical protein